MAKRKPSKARVKSRLSKTAGKSRATPQLKQLVITLAVANGKIAKIEHLASTGTRRPVSTAEFVALAGDDDVEDVYEMLEEAYAAGIRDGVEDALSNESFVQDSPGAQILKSGIQQIVLRRALRRNLGKIATAAQNGAQGAP